MDATKGNQPLDHGWSWVICLGAGVQAFFVVGGLKSTGVLFVEIVELFDAPRTVISLTLGLLAGGFAIFAMLTNALTRMVGIRSVVVCGCLLFTTSIFMAMFALNVWYLIITLGLMTGMALGAMVTPSVLLVSYYFDKKKSFANGVALAGSSVGQLCLPYLLTYLIDEYGFRGAMLIYSAISLHAVCAALLLRPISFWGRKKVKPSSVEMVDMTNSLHLTDPRNNRLSLREEILIESLQERGQWNEIDSESVDNPEMDKPGNSGSTVIIEDPWSDEKQEERDLKVRVLCCKIRRMSCREFCRLIFDQELLKSPVFWLLFVSLGLGHDGFINAMLHIPALAQELFHDKYKGALLITIAGIFDIFGRIGGGWFADLGFISRTNLSALAFTITGLTTLLVTFNPIMASMIVHAVIMGLIGGIYRILVPVIVGDVFGVAKLGPGIGMMFTALGIMIVPVPSLLGYMKYIYGSYLPAFQLCGALLLTGAAMLFSLPLVSRCDRLVQAKTSDDLHQIGLE